MGGVTNVVPHGARDLGFGNPASTLANLGMMGSAGVTQRSPGAQVTLNNRRGHQV